LRGVTLRSSALLALQHRNYRLLFLGQLVSLTGSMMQSTAILWHVSLLAPEGGKALALGIVGLVRVVPIVVFSLIGGVMADAVDRRRLMLVTQSFMTVLATVLTVLTLRGLDATWPIYVLTGLSAAANSFDAPARQALMPTLVPREHLPNAVSLYSMVFQIASVAGPAFAGAVIALAGIQWVYAINAASFLAVIAGLLMMRGVAGRPAPGTAANISLGSALEGLRFVFRAPLIRSTMLLDFFATFFSSATALLPIFAQDILHVGAHGYGLLFAAPAAGALAMGVLMVRFEPRIERRGATLLWAVTGYGLATVVFGISRSFWLTFACLALTGAADMVSLVLRNIIRQLGTPDHLRGRMTSVNMVFFMGGPQLGELEAGLVAQWIGAPLSVVTGGLGCLVATAWVAQRTPLLRRYRRDEAPPAAAAPDVVTATAHAAGDATRAGEVATTGGATAAATAAAATPAGPTPVGQTPAGPATRSPAASSARLGAAPSDPD
jgi:MFS family permease